MIIYLLILMRMMLGFNFHYFVLTLMGYYLLPMGNVKFEKFPLSPIQSHQYNNTLLRTRKLLSPKKKERTHICEGHMCFLQVLGVKNMTTSSANIPRTIHRISLPILQNSYDKYSLNTSHKLNSSYNPGQN